MRYEFSWSGKHGEPRRFTSGCPQVAEIMLLSGSDTPKMPPEMHAAFRQRFGQVRGALQEMLRSCSINSSPAQNIESGVPGLTITIRNKFQDDFNLELVQ